MKHTARQDAARLPGIAAAALSAMLLAAPAAAQYGPGYYGGGHMGGGWISMIFGLIMTIAVIAAIVVAIVLLVRWLGSGAGGQLLGGWPRSAQAILEERYARGEIEREEYLQKKKDLG